MRLGGRDYPPPVPGLFRRRRPPPFHRLTAGWGGIALAQVLGLAASTVPSWHPLLCSVALCVLFSVLCPLSSVLCPSFSVLRSLSFMPRPFLLPARVWCTPEVCRLFPFHPAAPAWLTFSLANFLIGHTEHGRSDLSAEDSSGGGSSRDSSKSSSKSSSKRSSKECSKGRSKGSAKCATQYPREVCCGAHGNRKFPGLGVVSQCNEGEEIKEITLCPVKWFLIM
ncbi:hypothetical protein Maes01_01507 [Microbulbifer aestuariivivens]|uniref:Uncharacterized protein n=1 Tax=Microbulbifer aestuariivivens TaxID=1908308 RepID=A0ABP9WRQ6_9GAMM